MKPIILQIPDSFPDRRDWLERQLVDLELGELVSELLAIHQSRSAKASAAPPLAHAFAGQLPQVLVQGLSVLTEKQLGLLLKHPTLLLELQDAVLEQGSEYWDAVPRSDEFERRIVAAREALSQKVADLPRMDSPATKNGTAPQPVVSGSPQPFQWTASKLLAIVAALVIGVTLWTSRPSVPTWGFDRSGILTANVSSGEYLNSLATAAEDWFNKRFEEPKALAKRLREFIHGCDTLIDAPHSQLSLDNKVWLLKRCQTCKSELEAQLAALESQRSTPLEVLDATEDIIRKLQDDLRQRSDDAV